MKDEVYEILNELGRGSYASVHKAINRRTGEICAIKKIPVTTALENLKSEIGILSSCSCENIVRFIDSTCSRHEVSIVMEYCSGGSVKDIMHRLRRTLLQDQITVILRDVLNGLAYLHAKLKIHRDVKAANILLNQSGIAKLGDFGVSESHEKENNSRLIAGTRLWLPPEVINQDKRSTSVIDIWSLGITVIEMGDGEPPYNGLEWGAAANEIKNLAGPSPTFRDSSKWSGDMTEFLALCLVKDANKRLGAAELLGHNLFANCPSNSLIKQLIDEACSENLLLNETEANLFKRSECQLRENSILLNIYRERRMKVIKVDQMTESLAKVKREFRDLENALFQGDNKVTELRSKLKSFGEEVTKLQSENTNHESTLKAQMERKRTHLANLNKIREEQKKFEINDLQRKFRLNSLEEGSG